MRFADMSGEERRQTQAEVEQATVWVSGLDRIQKVRGIRMTVDMSATPFHIRGSGYEEGTPLSWIVSDFGLVDAIESGITVSHVTLDSPVWEGAAVYHLEQSPHVLAYVRNEQRLFEIPYEHEGQTHAYCPDFLVRLDLGKGETLMLLVEVKGFETEKDRAKEAGAKRWVRAVNNHGGFGRWDLLLCRQPNELGRALGGLRRGAAA
ncbi:MAG: hypothetical protein HY744_12310 [Deltaproteobacteria bacterium]|nr:hypothetical protein [Deltaproteobacteria bacterium]